jgi:uncharacterized membrane protein YeaQ/YmgE (transglycosylase-associated protein family)
MKELSLEQLKAKQNTLIAQNMAVGLIGSIAGVIYSKKTGGGFLRGVGYFIVGGIVVGLLPRLFYFIPKTNEVNALIEEKEKLN